MTLKIQKVESLFLDPLLEEAQVGKAQGENVELGRNFRYKLELWPRIRIPTRKLNSDNNQLPCVPEVLPRGLRRIEFAAVPMAPGPPPRHAASRGAPQVCGVSGLGPEEVPGL